MIKNQRLFTVAITIILTLIFRELIDTILTAPTYVIIPGWHAAILSPGRLALYGSILIFIQILMVGYIHSLIKRLKAHKEK
ncbi:hypothetical protein BKI52_18400 [marine bacterium AO1-C]|nr:hypothetical protein BKI52_18400 [marine bacterium AO1-C]